jgi:hypothetical protein
MKLLDLQYYLSEDATLLSPIEGRNPFGRTLHIQRGFTKMLLSDLRACQQLLVELGLEASYVCEFHSYLTRIHLGAYLCCVALPHNARAQGVTDDNQNALSAHTAPSDTQGKEIDQRPFVVSHNILRRRLSLPILTHMHQCRPLGLPAETINLHTRIIPVGFSSRYVVSSRQKD